MSQTAVVAYCQTLAGQMADVTQTSTGTPEPVAWTETLVTVRATNDRWDRQTCGATGQIRHRYWVEWAILLGPANLRQAAAALARTAWADRLRAATGADHTLGGRCFASEWAAMIDNLATYQTGEGAPPTLTARLEVEEWHIANSQAA